MNFLDGHLFPENQQPLIMESWSPDSQDQDAFSITYILGQGIQIGLPINTNVRWNDFGGAGKSGDPIYAWDGPGQNTVWQVVLAPQLAVKDARAKAEKLEPVAN